MVSQNGAQPSHSFSKAPCRSIQLRGITIFGTLGEALAGLGATLADHDVALIEQNAILAHLEAILADRDAIWANNNSLLADRRMPWKRKIYFLTLF